ncbi:MAG: hypothetical protein MUP76_07950, partial [Acidimicrobiia bacterium]|nr:hypothetical protein [Acidimicrobiia bacterium]
MALSQVSAVADSGGSGGVAGPDLPRVSNLLGGDFRISGPAATTDESGPAVAHNPINNQYLVVWRDGRKEATRGFDIYGQRFAANGTRIGGNFRISGPAATT